MPYPSYKISHFTQDEITNFLTEYSSYLQNGKPLGYVYQHPKQVICYSFTQIFEIDIKW